jgi:hypothetical protein
MIPFTIAQVNELLQALGNIPYVYAKPLIDGVNAIAKAHLDSVAKEQQSDKETIKEPDTSFS